MSTNLEYGARERQTKRGGRPAKLSEKKGDRDLEQEIKNKGDIFLLEFSSNKCGGDKMRNASGHQCKMKMSGSEKKSERENV